MARKPAPKRKNGTPWLEYAASALGGAFAIGILAIILWHGVTVAETPPDIRLETVAVNRASGGYAVKIRARNGGGSTASEVEIEGRAGEETATTTFDFVPADGEREGTLVFRTDPGAGGPELRVLGYREP